MRFYLNCSRIKGRYSRKSASPGFNLMRRTFQSEAQKAKGRNPFRDTARCYPNFEGLLRKQTTTSLGGIIQEPQAKPAFLLQQGRKRGGERHAGFACGSCMIAPS